jgi:aspartyl protease family protein
MFRFVSLALVGALSAAGAAKAVVSLDAMSRRETPAAGAGWSRTAALSSSDLTPASFAAVARSGDGHYWAKADIDGQPIRFLVDTGATSVVLTRADAQALGIDPDALTYDRPVMTAEGRTEAAAVVLDHLSIAGARVNRVEALVIAEGLETSLLGMSYLGRLSRFEATPTALILHP